MTTSIYITGVLCALILQVHSDSILRLNALVYIEIVPVESQALFSPSFIFILFFYPPMLSKHQNVSIFTTNEHYFFLLLQ